MIYSRNNSKTYNFFNKTKNYPFKKPVNHQIHIIQHLINSFFSDLNAVADFLSHQRESESSEEEFRSDTQSFEVCFLAVFQNFKNIFFL